MALIQRGGANKSSGNKEVRISVNKSSIESRGDISEKKRKRTLAKQQQISESIAGLSGELLTKTQDGVSAIEQLRGAMEQISSAAEQNASAAEQSLQAINNIQVNSQQVMKDAEYSATNITNGQTALNKAGLELAETTECMFAFKNSDTSIKDGIEAMIQAGFVYSAEFEKEVFYDVD